MKRTVWLRLFALALCCFVLFFVSACGKKNNVETSTPADTVIIDSSADASPESAEELVFEEVEDPRAVEAVEMGNSEGDEFTKVDLDLDAMERIDAAISELIKDESFLVAEVKDRVTMVTEMLTKFVETGDIEKDSIFYENGSDVVSFSYKGGALGGVMVTEWAADMNGTHID